ncbi:dTDP-4-dehydrorhamnose reductase [Pseudemcibacter aquimaris]|uniref:dTDP-4-dehydrorhamnose reductase n=1 Tax=Pseudemcibacter aquimaris TaxID=2857064 RepID=UPI0020120375|nr:dTDP-4-dehydrorhamnose reductase [Pseudemcibacter aquimaris]MCC3862333.1 dTDP-4-dehydrorhamnose reductase [Pseudemcibacter aquimaris]WDU59236.1 dTDP-4-dehydrorhamnose reductase [Pseudemcibacter aquimaris]
MRVLITGSEGQLGSCLLDRVPDEWDVLATSRATLDITSSKEINEVLGRFNPEIVINTAAYTAVDKAEDEEDVAFAVNALGPKYLAEYCTQNGALLMHISTDYVFDGSKTGLCKETDVINPINVYGKTKAAGEKYIIESGCNYIIIRTSWVFSEYGNNFVKTMLNLAKTREEIGIVSDQFGGPTYAGDLAMTIIEIIKHRKDELNSMFNIFHYSGMPHTTWANFAEEVFEIAFKEKILPDRVKVNHILTSDYRTVARRPICVKMSCERIENTYKTIPTMMWNKGLINVLSKIKYQYSSKTIGG